jgi:hypothetical protein
MSLWMVASSTPAARSLGRNCSKEIRKRLGLSPTWLGRIIPASVVAQHQLVLQARIEHTLDVFQVVLVIPRANFIVFQPRPRAVPSPGAG